MIRQRHVLPLLSDYLDGCLSPKARQRVEAHLSECAACARELEQWRAVLQLVSRHASVTCPIDCVGSVLRQIDQQSADAGHAAGAEPLAFPRRRQGTAGSARLWASVAVVLGLLLGGWSWWQSAWMEPGPAALVQETAAPAAGPAPPAVRAESPERFESAFGRNDSLILASDLVADE